MKRYSYTIFAWLLASVLFWSIVDYRGGSRPLNEMTLPAGDPESVSAASRLYLANLMAEFPCGYEVELSGFQTPESSVWGWTTWDDEREVYEIHFYTAASLVMVQETLMHEYAHVLVWDAVKKSSHGGIYWAAYGNLYRFAIDE